MIRTLFAVSFLFMLISSCNSGPGPGGQATITGKIKYVGNWNSTCTLFTDSASGFTPFYAPDIDVYLIYGDDPTYGDRVKSAPDGTFQFKYLRTGKYTVYAYSKDCNAQAGTTAVMANVEVTDRKQSLTISDIRINK
ncbi:MAG TPA: hypothetical protein VL651_12155 [Bacteroidia bacterium]|jgi:hypothetical protein|nr:hypothetical protein [Bacteroidia bacterium]